MTILQPPAARTIEERRRDSLELLDSHTQLWLTTARDGVAHLIPVAYIWDGDRLTMATFARSRTTSNLRASPRARVAVGQPDDLVMIDGDVTLVVPDEMDTDTADRYARVSFDPRHLPGLMYLDMAPRQVQVWNGVHEFHGRTIMADGAWLDEPRDPQAALPAWARAI